MSLPLTHLFEAFARDGMGAMLNALWQGVVLATAVWCVMRLVPRTSAGVRYTVWCATLAAMLTLPLLALRSAGLCCFGYLQSLPPLTLPESWARALFATWYVIATLLIARLIWNYVRLQQIKASATPLPALEQHRVRRWLRASGGHRTARLCSSEQIPMPVAIGLRDPIIVIPRYLLDHLSDLELDQVGLHELAHLQRWDDVTNVAQKIAEALCFFNPVVHWVGRQLALEREIACDDAVVAATGKPVTYAACLTRLAESATLLQHGLPALGALAPRKQLAIRVERLLDRDRRSLPAFSRFLGATAAAAIAAAIFVAAQLTPVVAVPATPDVSGATRTAETAASSRLAAASTSGTAASSFVMVASLPNEQQPHSPDAIAFKVVGFRWSPVQKTLGRMHFIINMTRHALVSVARVAARNVWVDARVISARPAPAAGVRAAPEIVAMVRAPKVVETDAVSVPMTTPATAAWASASSDLAVATSDALAQELRASNSLADRARIVRELADRYDDAAARDALVSALAGDSSVRIRVQAAHVLADRAEEAYAKAALASALRASNIAPIQAIALDALQPYLDEAAIRAAVVEALRSENVKIRRAAAQTLAPYADEDAAVKRALEEASRACAQAAKATKASAAELTEARRALEDVRKAMEQQGMQPHKKLDAPSD